MAFDGADRRKPAEYAAEAFKPQHVDTPVVTVEGPLVSTFSGQNQSQQNVDQIASTGATETSSDARGQTAVSVLDVELDADTSKRTQKWASDRLEKRVRADYERSSRLLSEIVSDNLDTRVQLHAVRVVGAKSTRQGFLSKLIKPTLDLTNASNDDGQPTAQTLGSLLRETRQLGHRFGQFDIFRDVQAGLEPSSSMLASADDIDIVMRVQEAPKYFIRTATDVGDGEGSATGTAKIRNAFGGAETIEGNVSFGTRTKNAFQLRFDTPVNGDPLTRVDLSLFSSHRDLTYFAGCFERARGFEARLRTLSRFGLHELAYDAVLRQVGEVAPSASLSIREAAGDSVKSAMSHTWTRDTRDDLMTATRGSLIKARQELAGLGGDVHFIKADNEFAISRELSPGTTLSFGAKSGVLLPLAGQSSSFIDRFHLGGPTSVRQFRPNAMGPRDNNDYTGGDLFWAAGVSVLAPFPRKTEWPLKLHAFLNSGRLVRWAQTESSMSDTAKALCRHPSVTVGAGLMYRHSLVRVEANVGVPVAATAQEGTVKGLQFGLGLSFL
ncbi:hypothetical protein OIO90_003291 [Microbotryomycetes sp. JL221]|nr:hypothetical protein OIO90_003291 [Microbotryomycetes sp. JL221]